jgi:hypothetical protein
MEKYNLNEGNKALNRVLLMMKYDSKKTLVENKEVLLSEQVMIINQKRLFFQKTLSKMMILVKLIKPAN